MASENPLPQPRAPRHRLGVPVELADRQGRCRDLSNSGMFFEIDEPLEPGTMVSVSLILNDLLPMPPVQLEALGRVVRVERVGGKAGIAIEFASVRFETAETRAALRPE